jgi:hypothetical protein
MISLPNPTSKMSLSSDQLRALIKAYANDVVDAMDVRDLCAFAIDTICDNMDGMSETELLEELGHYYDEDVLNELIESVTSD